jgi:hypothetical protein
MQFLILKLSIEVIGAVCKLIGELWWHNSQRFIMPVCYGIAVSIVSHTWWLELTVLPMIGTISLGYKDFGTSDAFDRGMWLFLIGITAGLGPALTHHLSWFVLVPFCVICGVWGATTRGLWNVIIALVSGLLLMSLIWFIH